MPFLKGTLILVSGATVFLQYSHNTLPLVSTVVTPFQCVFGYQPSLFPDLEKKVSVPLAVPTDVGSSQTGLLRSSEAYKRVADRKWRPAPPYDQLRTYLWSLSGIS